LQLLERQFEGFFRVLNLGASDFGGNVKLLSWDTRVLDSLSEFNFIAIDWSMLACDNKQIVEFRTLGSVEMVEPRLDCHYSNLDQLFISRSICITLVSSCTEAISELSANQLLPRLCVSTSDLPLESPFHHSTSGSVFETFVWVRYLDFLQLQRTSDMTQWLSSWQVG